MTRVPKARPEGAILRFGRLSATDGPYAETKEVLGGALVSGADVVLSRRPVARRGALQHDPIDEEFPGGSSAEIR